jgi:hypothetical protein
MKVYFLARNEHCHECGGMDVGSRVYANLDDAKSAAQTAHQNMCQHKGWKVEVPNLEWREPEEHQEYFDLEDTYFSGCIKTGAIFHGTNNYTGFFIMEYEVL